MMRCRVMEEAGNHPGPRQEGRSHAGVWGLVTLGVMAIYFLGVPPLMYLAGPSLPGERVDPFAPCPAWVFHVAEPWAWLQRETFLRRPMTSYEAWWVERSRW